MASKLSQPKCFALLIVAAGNRITAALSISAKSYY